MVVLSRTDFAAQCVPSYIEVTDTNDTRFRLNNDYIAVGCLCTLECLHRYIQLSHQICSYVALVLCEQFATFPREVSYLESEARYRNLAILRQPVHRVAGQLVICFPRARD